MQKDEIRERLVELLKTNACPSPFMCDPTCRYYGYGDCFPDRFADHLIANGVTVQEWIPASEPPEVYRDEYGELIPFLVCEEGYEYSFRALYDGKGWGDGILSIDVTHWMPLPSTEGLE